MKTVMKTIGIIALLALFATGCGGGGSSPAGGGTSPLTVGGAGLTLDQQAGGLPAAAAVALDINDHNEAVGYLEAAAGNSFTAVLWAVTDTGTPTVTPRTLTPIAGAGNTFSAAYQIDEAGVAVGQSHKGGGAGLAAVYWPAGAAAPVELPPLNAAGNGAAFGISANGACIVGQAQDAALSTRAVIWVADGTGSFAAGPVALPVTHPGSGYGTANGVARFADEIWVAGAIEDGAGKSHAYLWHSLNGGATFTPIDLGTAGEAGSTALAVDTSGRVAGESETSAGIFAAALWRDSGAGYSRTVLAADGAATGINDAGKAVGTAAGVATLWDSTTQAATPLFTTASQAYGVNGGDASGFLVVGVNGGKGFVKKMN